MKRFKLLVYTFIVLFLVACTGEDPNPELKDPIYLDLRSKASREADSIKADRDELEDTLTKLAKTEPLSIERKTFERDATRLRKQIFDADQLARYFTIRAERRRVVGRKSYKDAHAKGEEWPDPSEYSDYQVNTRLRGASRHWADRVPRLEDRLPSRKPAEKDKKKEEEVKEE
jgi:hypothetical protein